MQTHESFIARVAELAAKRLKPEEQAVIRKIKLLYGTGPNGLRGVTYFKRWQNGASDPAPLVEICAGGEDNWLQLAETTLHELGHVLAGWNAGHGNAWKSACKRLGLRRAMAAGQSYTLALIDPDLRFAVTALELPVDGAPVHGHANVPRLNVKPCSAGVGTRGGTSRGTGSGSRLIKVECEQCGYIARVARSWLTATGTPLCPCNRQPMTQPTL